MTFTLHIRIDNTAKADIKYCIAEEVALFLQRNGYKFDVGFDPREIDFDNIGKV